MQELGCAIPHSDFLTLLSSVYSWLKIKTTPAVIIQDIITSNCGAWLSITTLRYFCLAKYYPDLKMKTTYKIKVTQKGRQPQKWKWPQIWRQMKKISKQFCPPPFPPITILPELFWRPLILTATPQMMLSRKCYQVSKPEIEFHMMNIMYAALHMRAHT